MEIEQSKHTVDIIHAYLESQYQTKDINYNLFSNISSDDELVLKEMGYNRFLLNEKFDNVWETANLDEPTKNDVIAYCTRRLIETKNQHLLARYNHALLVMTKNNLYANGSIEAYFKVADLYLKESKKDTQLAFEFLDTVKCLLQLCISYNKAKIDGLVAYLQKILDQNYSKKLKTGVLGILACERVLKAKDIQSLPDKCLEIYNEIEDDNGKERVLEIGLTLSQRLNDNEKIHIFAELLGDITLLDIQEYDGVNMAISHMNEIVYQKAITYYILAKNEDKVRATTLRLEENRTHHQYPRIPIYTKADNRELFVKSLNQLVRGTLEKSLLEILYPICRFNHSSLLITNEQIEDLASKTDDYYYTSCFEAVSVDKWGNKHPTTHKAVCIRDSFCIWFRQSTLLYIPILLCNCMKYKKRNINQFRGALKKSGLFVSIPVKRSGGYVHIPLYDIVGRGLEDFIRQNNESFKDSPKPDWRFSIDFLTPKFEFIIRSIASILDIPVVKTRKDGEVQFITLEKILSDPKLKDVFDDDDILLFKHTFTKNGMNVRNNVAHGLYLPEDYTKEIAVLVFLSVLRLCKYTDFIVTRYKEQSETASETVDKEALKN